MINTPNKIITHHAVSGKNHNHLDVGRWHYERWGGYRPSRIRTDIARYAGYHIVINWDGSWVQCRDFDEEGIHCRGQNFSSIGVCFMGNNDVHYPSAAQKHAWKEEVYPFIKSNYFNITPNRIYPHRNYANKSCHGKLLSDNYWTLQLGQEKKPDIKELQEKLIQLMNQLLVLLTQERMR